MPFSFNSLKSFQSFDQCTVAEKGETRPLPGEIDKKFLFFHWKVKLMAGVDRKTNELQFAYFSKFERLIRDVLPKVFFRLDISKDKVCECLKTSLGTKVDVRSVFGKAISEQFNQTLPLPHPSKENIEKPSKQIVNLKDFLDQDIHVDQVKEIIDSIPDLNALLPSDLNTPLTLAIEKNNRAIIEYLVKEKHVNPNQPNRNDKSPLAVAIEQDLSFPTIQILLGAGAKPKHEKECENLIKFARNQEKQKLVAELEKFRVPLNS